MKTLDFLRLKKSVLLFVFSSLCIASDAQENAKAKSRKLETGIFAEGFREFKHTDNWDNPNICGFSSSLAFRYCISKTFRISAGLGASYSIYGFKESTWEDLYQIEFAPSPYVIIGNERKETSIRLPINLQANIYKQNFFLSGGFEFFKTIDNVVTARYRDIRTNALINSTYKHGGNAIDIQFCVGAGWNFNAFSIESNLKFYTPMDRMKSVIFNDIFSPSLRLGWYFIK